MRLTAEVKEIIRRARGRIANPENFCQFHYAVDQYGIYCSPDDAKACKFSSLWRAAYELGHNHPTGIVTSIVARFQGLNHLLAINDERGGHAKVLAFFDKALAE